MSRTDTALNPLVANNSSAAARIASRRFGLRAAGSLTGDLRTIFVLSYKRSGRVNKDDRFGRRAAQGGHRGLATKQWERVSMPGLNKGFVGLVAGAALLL